MLFYTVLHLNDKASIWCEGQMYCAYNSVNLAKHPVQSYYMFIKDDHPFYPVQLFDCTCSIPSLMWAIVVQMHSELFELYGYKCTAPCTAIWTCTHI